MWRVRTKSIWKENWKVMKRWSFDLLITSILVLCGNETWKPRNILLDINNAKIVIATSSPSTSADSNDVIDLTQSSYIHSDVRHQDIAFTAKQGIPCLVFSWSLHESFADVPYSFKIEVGVKNSCWPTRQVYFLASSFADKNLWVKKLEEIVSRYSSDTSSRLSNSVSFSSLLFAAFYWLLIGW